jgi:hypothetical protein
LSNEAVYFGLLVTQFVGLSVGKRKTHTLIIAKARRRTLRQREEQRGEDVNNQC